MSTMTSPSSVRARASATFVSIAAAAVLTGTLSLGAGTALGAPAPTRPIGPCVYQDCGLYGHSSDKNEITSPGHSQSQYWACNPQGETSPANEDACENAYDEQPGYKDNAGIGSAIPNMSK